MKKLITIFLFISAISFAQINETKNRPSIFANAGAKYSSLNYRGNPKLNISAGFGLSIPLFKNISLYGKGFYTKKSNFTGYDEIYNLDQELRVVNQLIPVNASFSQLVFNTGLEYNIFLPFDFKLGLAGGISYSVLDHEVKLNGAMIQNLNNYNLFGYFGGISLEKKIEDSDWAIFGDLQYNYFDDKAVYYRDIFRGMNFMIGLKYYWDRKPL